MGSLHRVIIFYSKIQGLGLVTALHKKVTGQSFCPGSVYFQFMPLDVQMKY